MVVIRPWPLFPEPSVLQTLCISPSWLLIVILSTRWSCHSWTDEEAEVKGSTTPCCHLRMGHCSSNSDFKGLWFHEFCKEVLLGAFHTYGAWPSVPRDLVINNFAGSSTGRWCFQKRQYGQVTQELGVSWKPFRPQEDHETTAMRPTPASARKSFTTTHK